MKKASLFTVSRLHGLAPLALALALGGAVVPAAQADTTLTNASFDVARELFAALNKPFIAEWDKQHQDHLVIKQTHAGSSTQARSIIQGLNADVVTFNQTSDIDVIAHAGLIDSNWQQRLPEHSSPFYSTMAFLVRKGNPKHLTSWQDLAEQGVELVFPNPKTSGNGRYTYLGAWASQSALNHNDEANTEAFMRRFLANAVVLDSGGRGATTSFIERGQGDALITFESEARSLAKQYGDKYEVVVPKVDVIAEMPVAWVDASVRKNNSEALAKDYLNYLYTPQAQTIIADHFYRVRNEQVAKQIAGRFPDTHLLNISDVFGSWDSILSTHFASGGKLDQLQRQ
ncbi:thiosulfate ABC transporter substrate-binding protein CysP [Carnimonas nigrificans]|uniref:thiosulfate ABC transporter substrate-binding protein CysP n=1 Tax=Carnimonas nigrificans TaxID=64323 RepID=UPI0004701307|nr:thiosulfate ABC transporter substrate-binding protein CysP [Carnimonas nigrificans]